MSEITSQQNYLKLLRKAYRKNNKNQILKYYNKITKQKKKNINNNYKIKNK